MEVVLGVAGFGVAVASMVLTWLQWQRPRPGPQPTRRPRTQATRQEAGRVRGGQLPKVEEPPKDLGSQQDLGTQPGLSPASFAVDPRPLLKRYGTILLPGVVGTWAGYNGMLSDIESTESDVWSSSFLLMMLLVGFVLTCIGAVTAPRGLLGIIRGLHVSVGPDGIGAAVYKDEAEGLLVHRLVVPATAIEGAEVVLHSDVPTLRVAVRSTSVFRFKDHPFWNPQRRMLVVPVSKLQADASDLTRAVEAVFPAMAADTNEGRT